MRFLLTIILCIVWVLSFAQGAVDLINSREIFTKLGAPISEINITIPMSRITYLGLKNIDEVNLLTNTKTDIAGSIKNATGRNHTYEYDNFIIQTSQEAVLTDDKTLKRTAPELYYTLRMVEIFRIRYSKLYTKLVTGLVYPDTYNKDFNNTWFNRYPRIIISFNTVSSDVAISGTWLNSKSISFKVDSTALGLFENFPYISINAELIKGKDRRVGSFPIYQKDDPDENYLQYLKEGLLHSVAHELMHRYIDIYNNRWSTIANCLYFGAGRVDREKPGFDKHLYNFEEVIVNKTLDKYFKDKGGLSEALLGYYTETEKSILNSIPTENLERYVTDLRKCSSFNEDYTIVLNW